MNCRPFQYIDYVNESIYIDEEFPFFCFMESRIKNIHLGNNIETIPPFAFAYSYVETINLENIKIVSSDAFYQCMNLLEITFSEKLEFIGPLAFDRCENLESIRINSQRIIDVGYRVFENCLKLNVANIVSLMSDIPNECFRYCRGATIPIVTSSLCRIIGNKSFKECNGSIILNEGLEVISDRAFEGSLFSSIIIPSTVKYIGVESLQYCRELETIEIPSSVSYIGEKCFRQCENLKSAVMGKNITFLPGNVFDGCYSLSNITFLGKIIHFEYCCFLSTNIKSFKLPTNSITKYGLFAGVDLKFLDVGDNSVVCIEDIQSSALNMILGNNVTITISDLTNIEQINVFYKGNAKYDSEVDQSLYYLLNLTNKSKIYVTSRYRSCTFCGIEVIHTNFNPFETQISSFHRLQRHLREVEIPSKQCDLNAYVTRYIAYFVRKAQQLIISLSLCPSR
ncbi:hypothetical protein TVAG_093820 [Trichomonas vaginalis G3]|uniref:Surface antigen BspA-like n=1 Tax=Trichomonas vaginalis (strain ATCC PRA-98 / G3) TaxID=412133 RepID=A2DBK5_TRIV3|nr:ribonuclease inhibitor domain-containing protein [Trichomonas vaginalis G3]EAY22208.1 hypothetical protein TVAG_093820 [Trichomonas vaginalis G3]KAI5533334.1 ribonuclease inhibitor domain-containing protein [Trichomonas vaginalis G3]|eukprot:XP_001583194.1 hypothetical protein [Trichomonas vaginalis G3]